MKRIFKLFLVLAASVPAFAGAIEGTVAGSEWSAASGSKVNAAGGTILGNGGDVVLCEDPDKTEMLDLYEAGVLRGFKYSKLPRRSYKVILNEILDRLTTVDPIRAEVYRKRVDSFEDEARFLRDITLVDVPDSDHQFFPNGCEIRQAAIQRKPSFPGDSYYIVDEDIWDALDPRSKAALVMHEVIYRDAVNDAGHTDSRFTRYLNASLFSDSFFDWIFEDYYKTLKLGDFDYTFVWTDPETKYVWTLWREAGKDCPQANRHDDDAVVNRLVPALQLEGQFDDLHESGEFFDNIIVGDLGKTCDYGRCSGWLLGLTPRGFQKYYYSSMNRRYERDLARMRSLCVDRKQ